MTKCEEEYDTYSKVAKSHAQNQHYARAHYIVTGILFTRKGTNMAMLYYYMGRNSHCLIVYTLKNL